MPRNNFQRPPPPPDPRRAKPKAPPSAAAAAAAAIAVAETPLTFGDCIIEGDAAGVRRFLAEAEESKLNLKEFVNKEVSSKRSGEYPPLQLAVYFLYNADDNDFRMSKYRDIVAQLLDAGAEPNNISVLGIVFRNDDSELLALFLKAGASTRLFFKREEGRDLTLLMFCAAHCGYKCAKMLLDAGAELNIYGINILAVVIQSSKQDAPTKQLQFIDYLIQKGANLESSVGESPLSTATRAGRLDIVKLLIQAKANVNATNSNGASVESTDRGRRLALHHAAQNGSLAALRVLVAAQAGRVSLDAPDCTGETALWAAASHGQAAVVKCLYQRGANPVLPDQTGKTPLHISCHKGHVAVVKELLSIPLVGLAVDTLDKSLQGALFCAMQSSNEFTAIELLGLLTAAGADVNKPHGREGLTALMFSCQEGRANLVHALLKCGANLHQQTRSIDAAAARGNPSQRTALDFVPSGHTGDVVAQMLQSSLRAELLDLGSCCILWGENDQQVKSKSPCRIVAVEQTGGYESARNWLYDVSVLPAPEGSSTLQRVPRRKLVRACDNCYRCETDADATESFKLTVCSGCRVAQYCSADCSEQRAAEHSGLQCSEWQAARVEAQDGRNRALFRLFETLDVRSSSAAEAAATGKLLLALGADPNFSPSGNSLLHLLCSTNDVDESSSEEYNPSTDLAMALLRAGAHLDEPNEKGERPLLIAARHGNLSLATVLLLNGVDPNASVGAVLDAENDKTARRQQDEGAVGGGCDGDGESPLIAATNACSPDMVRMLLAWKADVTYATRDGVTALSAAKELLTSAATVSSVSTASAQNPLLSQALASEVLSVLEAAWNAATKLVTGSTCLLLQPDGKRRRCKVVNAKPGEDGMVGVKVVPGESCAPSSAAAVPVAVKTLPSALLRCCSNSACPSSSSVPVMLSNCRVCRVAAYCSPVCRALHSKAHEKECRMFAEVAEKLTASLCDAVHKGDAAAVRTKLTQGGRAEVFMRFSIRGDDSEEAQAMTPLLLAFQGGSNSDSLAEIVDALAAAAVAAGTGVNVDFVDSKGPLGLAIDAGNSSVVRKLLAAGAFVTLDVLAAQDEDDIDVALQGRLALTSRNSRDLHRQVIEQLLKAARIFEKPNNVGSKCQAPACHKFVAPRGSIKCPHCLAAVYCSTACRRNHQDSHTSAGCSAIKDAVVQSGPTRDSDDLPNGLFPAILRRDLEEVEKHLNAVPSSYPAALQLAAKFRLHEVFSLLTENGDGRVWFGRD